MPISFQRFGSILILTLGLLALLLVGLAVGADLLCALCNQPIVGKYIQVGAKTYHKTCYTAHPTCPLCLLPMSGAYQMDASNQRFHPACFKKAAICQGCNRVIFDQSYVRDHGKAYHSACYQNTAKCEICQSPLRQESTCQSGHCYHPECYGKATKCSICNLPIQGEYFVDSYGRPTCQKHEGNPGCFVCHFPLITKPLADGRGLCAKCAESAVFPGPEADALFSAVKNELQQQFGLMINKAIPLHLMGQSELAGLGFRSDEPRMGKFLRRTKTISLPLLGDKTLEDQFSINILYGLPHGFFEEIAAHELTHAWQALACPDDQSDELREGTAEVVSYLYLQSRGGQAIWMKRILNNEVSSYREAFKKTYAWYQKVGPQKFFSSLPTMKTLP